MSHELTPWHYLAGTDLGYFDEDECVHGLDPRACQQCEDEIIDLEYEASDQRLAERKEGEI